MQPNAISELLLAQAKLPAASRESLNNIPIALVAKAGGGGPGCHSTAVAELDQVTESVTKCRGSESFARRGASAKTLRQTKLSISRALKRDFTWEERVSNDTELSAGGFAKRFASMAKKIVFGLGLFAIIVLVASFARDGMAGVHCAFGRWASLVTQRPADC